jgi:hypothetical protein
MKNIAVFSFALLLMLGSLSCNAQSTKADNKSKSSVKVESYCFYFSSRCVTCKTVEAEAKADIESLLMEQKNRLKSINKLL